MRSVRHITLYSFADLLTEQYSFLMTLVEYRLCNVSNDSCNVQVTKIPLILIKSLFTQMYDSRPTLLSFICNSLKDHVMNFNRPIMFATSRVTTWNDWPFVIIASHYSLHTCMLYIHVLNLLFIKQHESTSNRKSSQVHYVLINVNYLSFYIILF